jgi:hypothetical protein
LGDSAVVCLPAALARDFDRAVGRWAIVRCVDAVARSGFAVPRIRWEADGRFGFGVGAAGAGLAFD